VKEKSKIWLPIALMVVFALTRFPGLMPENFSAAYALAFCCGVYLPGRLVWWLPLTTLLATDILLNLLYYHVAPVGLYMLGNYGCFAGLIWLGTRFNRKSSFFSLLGGGILGAILFYLITNTLSWMQNPVYAKTLAGWIQALSTGVPGLPPTWTFFRNTLMSGGLFTALFVGAMKLSEQSEPSEEESEETDDEDTPEEAQA
jgi:hypothetical protein